MSIRFLCIDDEADIVRQKTDDLSAIFPELEFEVRHPKPFDQEITAISAFKPSGLLLDLRLDKIPSEEGLRIKYRAISLAQEMRTRMTENKLNSFPIVLWSVDAFFEQSYSRDKTSHDIFDMHFTKKFAPCQAEGIASKLISLSKGYDKIVEIKGGSKKRNIFSKMIDLEDEFDVLDSRISSGLSSDRKFPVHVFAESILTGLILNQGPLIDESHLACRLGVDVQKSEDWNALKNKLSKKLKYTGVFGDEWERWWNFKLIREWNKIHPNSPLQRTGANHRVDVLKKKYKLENLVPIEAIESDYADDFWNICAVTGKAVSITDSVKLNVEHRDWLDATFASLSSVLERGHIAKGMKVHPYEIARIKNLMEKKRDE